MDNKEVVVVSGHRYLRVERDSILSSVRWDVPTRNQGQMVEYAFAEPGRRAEADEGDLFMRRTDRSDGTVEYYRRAGNFLGMRSGPV